MAIPVRYETSVAPDQTPRSAASCLALYCLSMSFLWDARYKMGKNSNTITLRLCMLVPIAFPFISLRCHVISLIQPKYN